MDTSGAYAQVIAELDAERNIKVLYTRGDGILSREEVEEDGTTRYSFYLSDGHGDVRQLTDETGEVTDSYSYNSYGELKESQGETDNPYLYTGEYYDEGTGLYYLRARYLNPVTGTFTSMDTYRGNAYDPASLHRYTYAQNNPQMYNDPSGHMIGLIGMQVNAACSAIVRNRHAIHVMGMVNGMMNSIVNRLLGGEQNDVDAFITGYIAGAGFAAAYIGACAIAAIFEVQYVVHLFVGGYMAKEYYHELVIAFAFGVTGNWKAALVHLSIAGLCLLTCVVELGMGVKGAFVATGPRGKVSFGIKDQSSFLKLDRYSPANPGPLSEDVANTFTGGSYSVKILTEDTMMFRVFGGKTGKVGSFLSRTPQGGSLQSQLDLALNPAWGNTTEKVTKVTVPKGTVVYEGTAAPQNIFDSMGNVIGRLLGRGNQVYIPDVEAGWFW